MMSTSMTAVAVVMGEGRKPQTAPFRQATTRALDRYHHRGSPRFAYLPDFWLGKFGGLSVSGLEQRTVEKTRGGGVQNLRPHTVRHAFAAGCAR